MLTGVLAITSILLVLDGRKVAARQASETKRQLVLTEKAFLTSQRPWIATYSTIAVSPLSWEEKGARLDFVIEIKNVGKDPAFDVVLRVWPYIMQKNTSDFRIELKKYCDKVRAGLGDRNTEEGIVFPDQVVNCLISIVFERNEIMEFSKMANVDFFTANALVCLDYKSAITGKRHTTGLILAFSQAPEKQGGMPKAFFIDQTYSAGAISVAPWPFGSFAT
jgi:hypothetical protein